MAAGTVQRSIFARWIVPVDGPPLRNGVITFAAGRITSVEPWSNQQVDLDLGNCAVLPGFVNCHTHLDLGGLRGLVPPGPDFTGWLRTVIRHRRSRSPQEVADDIQAGIAESLAGGTTLIGDISAGGQSWSTLQTSPLRSVVFHELLGLPRDRARQAWHSASAWLRDRLPGGRCQPGLSPHAPYSVRASLFRLAIRECRRGRLPLAIHLGETRAESELLQHRRGPFVEFLTELGAWAPAGLVASQEELIHLCRAHAQALLVHANYVDPAGLGDLDTVVYCPRTHAAFGHDPYPLQAFLARNVRVGLGTDSLASNPDLSLLEEARFVCRRYPDIDPSVVLRLATLAGAEALGFGDLTGSLTPGKVADMAVIGLPEEEGDPCEQVLAGPARVVRVIIDGEMVRLS